MNIDKSIRVHCREGELTQDMLTFNRLGWYVTGSKKTACGHVISMIYIGHGARDQQVKRINDLLLGRLR